MEEVKIANGDQRQRGHRNGQKILGARGQKILAARGSTLSGQNLGARSAAALPRRLAGLALR
jgi:hypothetical protein